MADELQALLERIHSEGVRKAEDEREKILAAARAEAEKLVTAARQQAAELVASARRDAEAAARNGQETLRQAARDTLLSLRQQLQARLRTVVRAGVGEALGPEALAGLLAPLVQGALAQEGVNAVEVLLPPAAAEALRGTFLARLAQDLRERVSLAPVPGLQAGFRLRFDGGDVVYDFSDAALAEALCTFLNPKLAELVPTAAAAPAEPPSK
jgi:V/A-type H+-transporting ATPase subunit E